MILLNATSYLSNPLSVLYNELALCTTTILSTSGISTILAGTLNPQCAKYTIVPSCFMYIVLPAPLGPDIKDNLFE